MMKLIRTMTRKSAPPVLCSIKQGKKGRWRVYMDKPNGSFMMGSNVRGFETPDEAQELLDYIEAANMVVEIVPYVEDLAKAEA